MRATAQPANLARIARRSTNTGALKGNRTAAIYGAEHLTGERPALFCEGEFDVMTAWQELGDLAESGNPGAATTTLTLRAGALTCCLESILTVYDNDQRASAARPGGLT